MLRRLKDRILTGNPSTVLSIQYMTVARLMRSSASHAAILEAKTMHSSSFGRCTSFGDMLSSIAASWFSYRQREFPEQIFRQTLPEEKVSWDTLYGLRKQFSDAGVAYPRCLVFDPLHSASIVIQLPYPSLKPTSVNV